MTMDVQERLTKLGDGINIPWDRLFDAFLSWLEDCNQSRMGRRRRRRGVKPWDVMRFFKRKRLAEIAVRRVLTKLVDEDVDVGATAVEFVELVSDMSQEQIDDALWQFGI